MEGKSTFLEQIKAKQFKDGKLNILWNKVMHGEVSSTTLDVGGVFSLKGGFVFVELIA